MKKQFQSLTEKGRWLIATLTLIFTLGIGQMWADNVAKISFKNADMASSYSATKISGTPATVGDVNVSWTGIGGLDKQYVSSTTTKDSCVKIDQSAGADYTTKYLQFSSSKVITKVELYAAIPGSTNAANEVIVGWSGEPSDTPDTVAVVSIPGKGASALTTINFPNAKGIKYVRCYRQIKIKDGKFNSKGTNTGSGTTWAIAYAQVSTYSTPATTYTVTYSAGDGSVKEGKSLPTQAAVASGTVITLASADDLEKASKEFDGWLCNINSTKYAAGASYTMTAAATTFTAQWRDPAPKYTVTLMPAGGTCESYTGWTYDDVNNKYTKEVSSGTELALPTFTKANRTFKTWRKAGPTDVTSPITVTADVTLTAVWNATVEEVIYSWESPSGTVIETGGTAVTYKGDDPVDGDPEVNVLNNGNYVLQVSGDNNASSSKNHIRITLTSGNAVKSGDKVKLIAYANNPSNNTRPRLIDGSGNQLCVAGSNMPAYTDPYIGTLTVADGINTELIKLTRASGYTGTNTMVKKLQIVRPTLVEEANLRTVSFNSNGGSSVAAIDVASGQAVAKPADPTKDHNRFAKWQKNGVDYDFSTAVTANITLDAVWTPLYAVTYDAGEGSGTMSDANEYAAGDKVTLKANTFTPPTDKAFDKWVVTPTAGGDEISVSNGKFTMPAAAVTVTATWKSSYTVNYYDGETLLGSEDVVAGNHPTASGISAERDFYTLGWTLNDSPVALADVSANAGQTVTLMASYTPNYATSINIEQWVLDNGTTNSTFRDELLARHYKYANLNNLDSLNDDPSKANRNYAYLGQKVNKTDASISFLLKSGSTVKARFGYLGSTINAVIGTADPVELTSANYANTTPAGDKVYSYTATADVVVKFQCTNTATSVFKQIMIGEDIAAVTLPAIVTLDANGGTYADASVNYTGTPLVIGDATPADADHVFAGWFDGEDQIDATAYVPTKNVTLQAHYANKPYTVTYVGGEGATGSMDPVQVAWGDDYTALACDFAKENHSFVKWTVAGVDAISEIAAGSAFVMPKGNVTLTAQWANDLLVARIGDDYYESLPLAVAAAIASEETSIDIQLLAKDGGVIEGSGVKIPTANKTITIDFNGMKYIAGDPAVGSTGTETQAFQLLMGNNITLKNGAIACKAGSNVKMLIQNYSNLTLKNIRLEGENLNIAASGAYTLSNNNGAVVIGNGTEVIAKEGGIAFDVCYYASYPSVSVTVQEGASIDGKIEMSMSNGKQNVEENCQLIVTGGEFENFSIDHTNIPDANVNAAISAGTFDAPVENLYCAENYVPATISAGVYSVEPKTGICLIKANVGNDSFTIDTDASLLSGTADKKNVRENNSTYAEKTGWKFQSRPAYLGITLDGDETFQAGDVVEVFVTSVANISGNNDKMRVMSANSDDKVLKESTDEMVLGINRLELPTTSTKSIYLRRSAEGGDYENFNPFVAYVAVYRIIYPTLTAITINDVVATKGEGNTFTITLPEAGTNLNALDVVPTIIRNAAHATTPEAVVGGTWAEGANTYRVMDKDGDYTDYTITITLQGEAPAPVISEQPATQAYCAGSEPTLTVVATGDELHYAWFKEAGETDEAVGDAASYTIASAGTYYVIVTNHVDGKLDKSVTSENAVITLNVAAAITTQPTNKRDVVSGSDVTLSVVATNAASYQWYTCDDAEKHNAVAVPGEDEAEYTFACTANGYYYCVVGNNCGDDLVSNVVSVKLEPEGCNVISSIPSSPYIYDNDEWTLYAVTSAGKLDGSSRFKNNAKDFEDNTVNAIEYGRIGMTFAKDVESLTIYTTASSSSRVISDIKVTSDDITTGTPSYTSISATKEAEALGKKTSSSPYRFVMTADNMLLEAGKKYWIQFDGTVSVFRICYTEALAEPVLPTLGNQELCAGAAYVEMDATITNVAACTGTVSYQWYNAANDEAIEGANAATFTPSAEGDYYVVVRHAAAGHMTREVKSANINVAHFDALAISSVSEDVFQHMGTATTLSVVATGKNVAYKWYTCDDAAGNGAVAIVPAQTEASLAIASILEGVHYYMVEVSHDCDATVLSRVIKVEGWDQLEQVDVTETTTWNMANSAENAIDLSKAPYSCQDTRLLLANIDGVNNNASFNSQALKFEGQHIGRTGAGIKHLAGRYVQFNVTVPGAVFVTFESNGDNARTISINGKKCSRTTSGTAADKYITYAMAVEPGSVEIMGYEGESANKYVRISKIEFKAEASHTRSGLNPSYLGTLCWTNNAILGGATLYEFAGKDEHNYLVFDEVEENRLEAGKPYIFMPENGNTEIKVYNIDESDPMTESQLQPVNNMYGTLDGKTLVPGEDDNMYYFSSNHIWAVKDFTVNIPILPNRCYIDYPAVLAADPAPAAAPGRRRVTMGVNGQNVATGMGEIEASETPVKVLINGQIFIIRGEKMFDVTGKLVK